MNRSVLFFLMFVVNITLLGCSQKTPNSPSSSSSSFSYPYSFSIGNGSFTFDTEPSGVVVSSTAIYVVDQDYSAIDKFDLSGNYQGQNPYTGDSNLQGLALDKNGNVYVADWGNSSVDEFDSDLNPVSIFTGGGNFDSPSGVRVDSNLNIYVADFTGGAIYEDNSTDTIVNTSSSTPPGFQPYDLTLTSNGTIYVTDAGDSTVDVFNAGLTYKSAFDGSDGGTAFSLPTGIVMDSQQRLIIADQATDLVQKFTTSGEFMSKVTITGGFANPYFLATDANNRLYVSDYILSEIFVFNPD